MLRDSMRIHRATERLGSDKSFPVISALKVGAQFPEIRIHGKVPHVKDRNIYNFAL